MPAPIVVATDFSARADRAIDRAIMLGEQLGRPVILVHALDSNEAGASDRPRLDRQMRGVLPEHMAGAERVEFRYPEGSAPQALAKAAEEAGAGLVLMGPARHNSLRDFLLGTAVDYTLRHCDQPVLIVKQRPHRPYGTIVVATDFSDPSARAFERALEWFPEAAFHLVHGCHVPFDAWQKGDYVRNELLREARGKMATFFDALPLDDARRKAVQTHVDIDSAFEMVNTIGAVHEADLVVLGSQGESGFRHATIGSTANALLTTTSIDTLMVTNRG